MSGGWQLQLGSDVVKVTRGLGGGRGQVAAIHGIVRRLIMHKCNSINRANLIGFSDHYQTDMIHTWTPLMKGLAGA